MLKSMKPRGAPERSTPTSLRYEGFLRAEEKHSQRTTLTRERRLGSLFHKELGVLPVLEIDYRKHQESHKDTKWCQWKSNF